jgi:hypothetical protein
MGAGGSKRGTDYHQRNRPEELPEQHDLHVSPRHDGTATLTGNASRRDHRDPVATLMLP